MFTSNLNHQFLSQNWKKAIVIKNVLRMARQDTPVVPPNARLKTAPVNSARRQFDSVCRKKLAQKSTVQVPGHASTKYNIADQQLYEMIGRIGDLHSDSWLVSTQIDGVNIQKQVDTGSKIRIIPLSFLMVIGKSKHQLEPASNLKGYGQKPLSCIGMFTDK